MVYDEEYSEYDDSEDELMTLSIYVHNMLEFNSSGKGLCGIVGGTRFVSHWGQKNKRIRNEGYHLPWLIGSVWNLESRKDKAKFEREGNIMVKREYGARKFMGFDLFFAFPSFLPSFLLSENQNGLRICLDLPKNERNEDFLKVYKFLLFDYDGNWKEDESIMGITRNSYNMR